MSSTKRDTEAELQLSITRLKLLNALKSGPEEVEKVVNDHPEVSELKTLPHLAVQLSQLSTLEWLFKRFKLYINAGDNDANTPLHLAAQLGRQEVALFLLSHPDINDTLTNNAGKQAVEEAKTPEVAEAMQYARARYVEKIASELRTFLNAENVPALEDLFSHPRAASLLDINGQDPDTGSTVLHDFVRKRKLKMVEFILNHGGDPFRRDSKGVLPLDVCRDDGIKRLLKAASKEQPVITGNGGAVQEAPYIDGYLKKWTNFTGGYKLRWFVLENGVLSYYKKQADTERACRGSINMKSAKLHLDSSEKTRFEITTRGSSAKFHLKANHPVETNRWVWALTNAIRYAKDQDQQKLGRASSVRSQRSYLGLNKIKSRDATSQFTKDDTSAIVVIESGTKNNGSFLENDLGKQDEETVFDDDESDFEDEVPYEDHQQLVVDTVRLEVKAIHEVIDSLGENQKAGTLSEDELRDGLKTIGGVVDTINVAVQQLVKKVEARESHFRHKLEQSEAQQRLWAQNIRDLEIEHEKVQQDLEALQSKHQSEAESEDDSEDEFFDFEEEEEEVPEPPAYKEKDGLPVAPSGSLEQQKVAERLALEESFNGYDAPPRTKLDIDDDKRPRISLWGVLKNLIGKDMTRMTLPVSFNECTNLLQRSAEDMEYVDLLEKAARTDDMPLRFAYIAAFCASSYSSTINRIAKPFNPLLGETFEYARPDKGYRLFSEQVSHHPPIGAMLAEHKKWDFFGNSHVKSKFNGRSFEIKPTGQWFIRLRPDSGGEELYSFRKVTSSVVGIIVGRPVVDNHGEMLIENHTKGWKCALNFAAMGWRSTNAYEVKGDVLDKEGVSHLQITGKWNDKIFYTRDGHKVCIWQLHERPKAPFNLTPFAMTLNALTGSLKSYIAPTDTRLRPDQRAMEEARYDDASEDKHRVEEKQRAARRQREAGNENYQPTWFTETKHPLTGELFYKPHGDYWQKRKEGKLTELSMDIF